MTVNLEKKSKKSFGSTLINLFFITLTVFFLLFYFGYSLEYFHNETVNFIVFVVDDIFGITVILITLVLGVFFFIGGMKKRKIKDWLFTIVYGFLGSYVMFFLYIPSMTIHAMDSFDYIRGHAPTEITLIQRVGHEKGVYYRKGSNVYYYVDEHNRRLYSHVRLETIYKGQRYTIRYMPRTRQIMSMRKADSK